jgi:hypothetical protein
MKQLGFLFGTIFVIMVCAYLFALPPLVKVIIKAELAKNDMEIVKIDDIEVGMTSITLKGIELTKNAVDLSVGEFTIKKQPVILLITKKAAAIEISDPTVYLDTTTSNEQSSALTALWQEPHKFTDKLLNTTIFNLHKIAPLISIKNIQFDIFTERGLITIKGDTFIQGSKILASFSSAQKQLTFNAEITGKIDAGLSLNAQIQNLNVNLDRLSLKRGQASAEYKTPDKRKLGHFESTLNAGLLKVNNFPLNAVNAKSHALNSEHKIYIAAQHSALSTDTVEYWYNIDETHHSSYLNAKNLTPAKSLNFYVKSDRESADNKRKILNRFFLDPADITVQYTQNKNTDTFNVSIFPKQNAPICKAQITEKNGGIFVDIEPYDMTAEQVMALAPHFLDTYIYEFKGAASLSGSFGLLSGSNAVKTAGRNTAPLSLHLKQNSFKTKNLSAQKVSGAIKLIQDRKVESVITFGELQSRGLKLRNGRLSMSLLDIGEQHCKIRELRSSLGTGSILLKHLPKKAHYIVNARRVNATSIPQEFRPRTPPLSGLINLNGIIKPLPQDGQFSLNIDYKIISTSQDSKLSGVQTDKTHALYKYLKYLGGDLSNGE